jgi:hypothetical protein
MSEEKSLGEIRRELDKRLAERRSSVAQLEQLKRENAKALRRGEQAKRILERA